MKINTKSTEIIVRQGKPKFRRKTTAKNMRGWINGFISKSSKEGNTEMEFIMREVLNAYNYYHPEKEVRIELEQWKGKSSFEIIDLAEKVTVIKYQKKEKGQEPSRIQIDIEKEELKCLWDVIKKLSEGKNEEKFATRTIAKGYFMAIGEIKLFDGDFWKNLFSNRKLHNKFTIMLGVLDRIGLIEYKGGKSKVIDSRITLQFAINNYI